MNAHRLHLCALRADGDRITTGDAIHRCGPPDVNHRTALESVRRSCSPSSAWRCLSQRVRSQPLAVTASTPGLPHISQIQELRSSAERTIASRARSMARTSDIWSLPGTASMRRTPYFSRILVTLAEKPKLEIYEIVCRITGAHPSPHSIGTPPWPSRLQLRLSGKSLRKASCRPGFMTKTSTRHAWPSWKGVGCLVLLRE